MSLAIFCLTLKPENEKYIKELSYIPVGLGNKKFSKNFFSDKSGLNISEKNPYYGEYTFHYWLWKNYLDKLQHEWLGFCQYRKFFVKENLFDDSIPPFEKIKENVITKIDRNMEKYDCILGTKYSLENYKLSKIIKHHLKHFLLNPSKLIFKNKRSIKFHFDIFHGEGNLDSAIDLLDLNNRNSFREYVNKNSYFNPHNMFICKKKFLRNYYETLFPWLFRCEKLFRFDELKGFGKKRIFGFLAERFLSYWFNKNCSVTEYPIIHKDLSFYK